MENKEFIQRRFVERLTDLMQEKNLNQAQLAKQTKIPQQTLSNWLTYQRTIQVDSLIELADFFGVTTDYLLGREN